MKLAVGSWETGPFPIDQVDKGKLRRVGKTDQMRRSGGKTQSCSQFTGVENESWGNASPVSDRQQVPIRFNRSVDIGGGVAKN